MGGEREGRDEKGERQRGADEMHQQCKRRGRRVSLGESGGRTKRQVDRYLKTNKQTNKQNRRYAQNRLQRQRKSDGEDLRKREVHAPLPNETLRQRHSDRQPTWARMHHKVVGNFGSEADVRSLYFRGFRFNDTSDNGACTHG